MARIGIDWISISSSYLTKAWVPDSIRGRRYQMIDYRLLCFWPLFISVYLTTAAITQVVKKM
jgi:hypothetical protein